MCRGEVQSHGLYQLHHSAFALLRPLPNIGTTDTDAYRCSGASWLGSVGNNRTWGWMFLAAADVN